MRTVSMREVPRDVVRRFHRDLLEPSFPEAERMTWDELDEALGAAGTEGLLVLEDDRPVAGLVTEEYLGGRLLLLAYVVVSVSMRGRGIGARLARDAVGGDPRPVLAEVEDPRFHPDDPGTGSPTGRVRFYDRLGSRLVPIPYVQPSLRPGSPRVDHLLLITIPSGGTPTDTLDGALLTAFLDEYYEVCEGPEVVAGDPAYRRLRDAAGAGGDLRLRELRDLEAARPGPEPPGPAAGG